MRSLSQDIPKRVVYFDENYDTNWISLNRSAFIAEYFKDKGFQIFDAIGLQAWMTLVSVEKPEDTVVVFSMDIIPNTIIHSLDRKSLIWRYLRAGGKIVWFGDIPFYRIGERNKEIKDLKAYGTHLLEKILGVISIDVWKLRPVSITKNGTNAGLKKSWNGIRPVKITSELTVLANSRNDDGKIEANAWENWGFIRLYDINRDDDPSFDILDYLDEIYRVALCPLNKIREKNKIKKDVFIVHGRDMHFVNELKKLLINLGLSPNILKDFQIGSETLIELLEKAKKCAYVFIILTPDDVGCIKSEINRLKSELDEIIIPRARPLKVYEISQEIIECLKPRTRQNVIFEFGFFIGAVEREKVCCLLSEEEEWDLPSDISGIYYNKFKKSIYELQDKIEKNLKKANLL